MRRREFITLLGGAAAAPAILRPHASHAQQPERMRRIGVLMNTDQSSSDGQSRFAAFRGRLQELGWSEDRNIRIDVRWGNGDVGRIRALGAELVALSPQVLLAYSSAQLAALSQATRSIPMVFVGVSDPVSAGYVASYARPGGNITGFTAFEASMGGKWVATLKEVAPATARVVNPATGMLQGRMYAPSFESGATTLGIEPVTADVRSVGDIEAAIAALGQRRDSGLVVLPETFTTTHREEIIALTARHRVPHISAFNQFPMSGGLVSYGPDNVDIIRRSASYIDRILKGEKPADLPVQAPTKYQLVINLKTAKALGLTVPDTLLARADELIE
jgi:putative ABC transport system substrate-binding protein